MVAIRHPDDESDCAHSFIASENEGAMESTKTVREELLEMFPAESFAEN